MGATLSRRGFLVGSSALTAGVLVASLADAGSASASATSTAWVLQISSRCRCSACRAHAANRVFASSVDASSGRAHLGCRCTVAPLAISTDAYQRAFVVNPVVDRRHIGVPAVLASGSAAIAAPAAAGPPTTSNGPVQAQAAQVFVGAGSPADSGAASAWVASNAPIITGPVPVHLAQGRTVTRMDRSALEWAPLPVAPVAAIALLVRFRNRVDEDGASATHE